MNKSTMRMLAVLLCGIGAVMSFVGCEPGTDQREGAAVAPSDWRPESYLLIYPVATDEWIKQADPVLWIGDRVVRLPVLIRHGGMELTARQREIGDVFTDFGLNVRGHTCKVKLAPGQREVFNFGTGGGEPFADGKKKLMISIRAVYLFPDVYDAKQRTALIPKDFPTLLKQTPIIDGNELAAVKPFH